MTDSVEIFHVFTNEGNVEISLALKTRVIWQTTECRNPTEDGIGLQSGQSLLQKCIRGTDLCTTVSRKGIVPQALVGTSQWLLVVVMVAMRGHGSSKAEES